MAPTNDAIPNRPSGNLCAKKLRACRRLGRAGDVKRRHRTRSEAFKASTKRRTPAFRFLTHSTTEEETMVEETKADEGIFPTSTDRLGSLARLPPRRRPASCYRQSENGCHTRENGYPCECYRMRRRAPGASLGSRRRRHQEAQECVSASAPMLRKKFCSRLYIRPDDPFTSVPMIRLRPPGLSYPALLLRASYSRPIFGDRGFRICHAPL